MKALDKYFLMVVFNIVEFIFLQILWLIWAEKHGNEKVK